MSYMLSGCKSLSYLPDISRWITNNVINIYNMLDECSLLFSISDISKWNINHIINISYMFNLL